MGASLVFTHLVKHVLCSLVTMGPVFLDHGGVVMLRSPQQRVAELEFDPNSLVLNLNLYTALPLGYLHIEVVFLWRDLLPLVNAHTC